MLIFTVTLLVVFAVSTVYCTRKQQRLLKKPTPMRISTLLQILNFFVKGRLLKISNDRIALL